MKVFSHMGWLLLACMPNLWACAPSKGPLSEADIRQAFKIAKAVFVAKVTRTARKPYFHPHKSLIREDVWLEITEVLKGSRYLGETVHIESFIGAGPCEVVNVQNDPPWIYVPKADSDGGFEPALLSDTWIIYHWEGESYRLDGEYSRPMNVGGADRVRIHRAQLREWGSN